MACGVRIWALKTVNPEGHEVSQRECARRRRPAAGRRPCNKDEILVTDALQAEELKKNQGKRVTRETRGWTREDLYNDDRGLPRGFPR